MLLVACLLSASATTLTFQAGDGGFGTTWDATLVGSAAASDQNFSADGFLYADLSDGDQNGAEVRPLIRFPDVVGDAEGQVPVGATIHQATLTLTVDNPGGTLGLYEVLEDWAVDEVSWDHRSGSLGDWAGRGAQQPSCSPKALMEVPSTDATVVFSTTAAVRQWARDPRTNFGFVVLPSSSDGADLHSSESDTVGARPLLTIEFTEPPPEDASTHDSGVDAVPGDSGGTSGGGVDDAGGGTGKDSGCAVAATGWAGGWLAWVGLAARRRRRG